LRRLFRGGSSANEQLTAVVAAVLLPLLAAEGAMLLNVRSLLNVHAFVGMLLVPVVALAAATLPAIDHLQDNVSGHVWFDER
jgi:hypothetical protein